MCDRHVMVVCVKHKRIIEQCDCTSASKRRIDVPCPGGCFEPVGG